MIPKVIHYCWFGRNPLPESAVLCINSWEKYFPDYEIKQWNEDNYNIEKIPYIKEAYEHKKYAFVSDYARFDILYHEGGIYFDTDVEVIKKMDDIISLGNFMGCEATLSGVNNQINPGLGLAAKAGLGIYKEMLDFYEKKHFVKEDGTLDLETIVTYTSNVLEMHGYDNKKKNIQTIEGITIYPEEYFCPMNYHTGELKITHNTRSIHHYSMTWMNSQMRKEKELEQRLNRKCGRHIAGKIVWLYGLPNRIITKIKKKGIAGTIKFYIKKIGGYKN